MQNCEVHAERIGFLDKKIDEMEKTIYGNGTEGIKVKVVKMEQSFRWLVNFLVPTITSILLGIGVLIFQYIVK